MSTSRIRYWGLAAIFKARGILMIPPLAYAFIHFDPRFEDSTMEWSLGLGLFVAGVYLRVMAQRHLRYRLHARKRLATTGPYAIIRNPVYWANIAMFAGLALMAELPWMAPVVALWAFVLYRFVIRFEELRLMKRFGSEYAEYAAATPRWIPKFNSLRDSSHGTVGANWLRSLAVESHCLLLIVFPIAKEIVEYRYGGWHF